MSKLDKAIELCKDNTDHEAFTRGLHIFDELIMNHIFPVKNRAKALLGLTKLVPDEGHDKIARIRDSIPFLEKDQERLTKEVELLCELVYYPNINSYERLLCAICLYNNYFIDYCYKLFAHLCNDISVMIDYRIDAIMYLLYSDVPDYVKIGRKCLMGIACGKDYNSKYRYYKVIAKFLPKNGLSTMINKAKLHVTYSEPFLIRLQSKFFWDVENGIRERILSASFLLDCKSLEKEEIEKVTLALIDIAENANGIDENDTENIRADAADVVLRMGLAKHRDLARTIIHGLGQSKTANLLVKSNAIYADKQNVHDEFVNRSVQDFISQLAKTQDKIETFATVHGQVSDLLYSTELEPLQRQKAFKSLNRISVDTATFTDYRLNIAEIFVHVWRLIQKHEKETKEELEKRTIEELIDMADTCASGHASRLINILSGYDFQMTISWEQQIRSNVAARMQKMIQNIEDEDRQAQIVLGMSDDAEPEDRQEFILFVTENLGIIRQELEKEFVGDGYIKKHEFLQYFETATRNWV